MYEEAFKKFAGEDPTPERVSKAALRYCKVNMKVASAKSMDELCAPIAKKIEDKMDWVPPDTVVTPELVCKSLDQIKKEFAEYAEKAQQAIEDKKAGDYAKEAEQRELATKAQDLQKAMGGDIEDTLKEVNLTNLTDNLRSTLAQVMGLEMEQQLDDRQQKILSKVSDSVSLGLKGLITKAHQKIEESVKEWVISEHNEKKRQELIPIENAKKERAMRMALAKKEADEEFDRMKLSQDTMGFGTMIEDAKKMKAEEDAKKQRAYKKHREMQRDKWIEEGKDPKEEEAKLKAKKKAQKKKLTENLPVEEKDLKDEM
jgi:hypothetical protein